MSSTLPSTITQLLKSVNREQLELAGVGTFAHVIKIADTGLVIKKPLQHPVLGNLQPIEKRIYERLGYHPFILRYYGEYHYGDGLPNGLVLQYQAAGTLTENIDLSRYSDKRIHWPAQAAEALRYIHSKNVIHNDIGSHNFLIQEDGTLALTDFGGSMIDNTSAVVSYATRYANPRLATSDLDSTEIDELFALGTVIYEIGVWHQLYAGKPETEIRKLLHEHKFPELDDVAANLQMVITKCWTNKYHNAEEVLLDLDEPNLSLLGQSSSKCFIM